MSLGFVVVVGSWLALSLRVVEDDGITGASVLGGEENGDRRGLVTNLDSLVVHALA